MESRWVDDSLSLVMRHSLFLRSSATAAQTALAVEKSCWDRSNVVCSNAEEFPRMDIQLRRFHDLAAAVNPGVGRGIFGLVLDGNGGTEG